MVSAVTKVPSEAGERKAWLSLPGVWDSVGG